MRVCADGMLAASGIPHADADVGMARVMRMMLRMGRVECGRLVCFGGMVVFQMSQDGFRFGLSVVFVGCFGFRLLVFLGRFCQIVRRFRGCGVLHALGAGEGCGL